MPDYRRACPSRIIIERAQVTTGGGALLFPVQCSSQGFQWTVAKSYAEIRILHSTIKKLASREMSGGDVKRLYDKRLPFPGKVKQKASEQAIAQQHAALQKWASGVTNECQSMQNRYILKAVSEFCQDDGSGSALTAPEPEPQPKSKPEREPEPEMQIHEAIPPTSPAIDGQILPTVDLDGASWLQHGSTLGTATLPMNALAASAPSPAMLGATLPASADWAATASAPPLDVVNVQLGSVAGHLSAYDKFVADTISLGNPAQGIHGVLDHMGCSEDDEARFLRQKESAIESEFMSGSVADKRNFQWVVKGTGGVGWQTATLECLLAHPNAVRARLKRHHVLALRLYTTSSFKSINNPLRQQRKSPFAATTYWISKAIGKLRLAEPEKTQHQSRVFWRGMRNLVLTQQFLQTGGTELACMSATEDQDVAIGFAGTECPLIFKVVTKDFHQRGADVAFLSVYPHEKEMLYPPLTYLRLDPAAPPERQSLAGVQMLVATVEPVYPASA
eukprot:COSAG01_NODE_614_length_14830_cov_87.820572_11_plen_505_part_00